MTRRSAVEIGERVARYAESNESYEILGKHGTWNAGGCSLLALALQRVLGWRAKLLLVASDRNPGEHTVVRYGGMYIDADGAQTERELLHKMATVESTPHPRLVPFGLSVVVTEGHIYSEQQVVRLVRELRRVLA